MLTPLLTALRKHNGLLLAAGIVCIAVNRQGLGPLWFTGVALLLLGGTLRWAAWHHQRPRQDRPPTPVGIPVEGRWQALNGPATKVPSHTHSHAQTYAIDLTHHPEHSPAPRFTPLWPLARRPHDYPAFGAPVLAPGDGVVVAVGDGRRDHLTRTSLPGYAYLFLEGFVRSLGRPGHLWGNHLVLHLDSGVYAAFAHLRRGSLGVTVGDRVTAGDRLAECGNSGNSSEPHVHFQLMTGPDSETAQGVPFVWDYRDDEDVKHTGVPRDRTYFTA